MKKLSITTYLVAICFLIMAPGVSAYQITITQNAYSYSNGGEFTATPSLDLAWLLNYYDANAKLVGGFETFCLEYTEYFNPGGTYNALISDQAMNGGVAPAGTGDPVSIGTAYLYSQFAQGILSGYFSGDRKANAGQLQLAFWWLEDEYALNATQIANNPFLQLLANMSNPKADANGAYGVSVLNLTTIGGGLVQDQLVYDPVPEPATLLLFGLGLFGLGLSARKFKKKSAILTLIK